MNSAVTSPEAKTIYIDGNKVVIYFTPAPNPVAWESIESILLQQGFGLQSIPKTCNSSQNMR